MLKKLKFDAEAFTSQTLDAAVITVPAHFNDPQRKAVLNAAMLADIPVLGAGRRAGGCGDPLRHYGQRDQPGAAGVRLRRRHVRRDGAEHGYAGARTCCRRPG